ncbi:MAG: alcohol dehydrogenase [Chloroflexota bacterium]|nr:MAG: alcohol dehydrogenase [Chloroflexota bacterium]
MRVAMYYSNSDLRLEEMPRPSVGTGELLVRIDASGICGSDVMEWYRRDRVPLVLGHEIAGEVVEVGEGVERFRLDQRVVAAHHVPCNTCHYCLRGRHTVCETLRRTNFFPGGFAEYIRLPAINVDRGTFIIPDGVSMEEASFAEPLACVLRGQRIAGVQPADCVLVLGSGAAGLLHVALAVAQGAGRVIATDVSPFRLQMARSFGAEVAWHAGEDVPAMLRELNDGRLADVVVLCTGAPAAVEQAFRSVERGGTVLVFAPAEPGATIPVPINDLFFRNDITVTTTYAGSPADHVQALELIRSRRVRVREMITHRVSLAEIGRGFELVARAQDSMKVIVEPQR